MRLIDAEAKICESEEWKKLKAKEKMNTAKKTSATGGRTKYARNAKRDM